MPKIERPDKKKPKDDLVEIWEHHVRLAERKLKDKGGDVKGGEWKELIRFFEGDQYVSKKGQEAAYHRITANQIKNNIDAIRPQLYFQNPKVAIEIKNPSMSDQPIQTGETDETGNPIMIPPRTPIAQIGGRIVDAQEQVDLMQAIDNYYLKETKAKIKFRRILNDALILPYGVSKWEWIVKLRREQREVPTGAVDPETNEPVMRVEETEVVERQYPKLTRIKPWCFIWDEDLDEFDFEKARWVAEINWLSREDLEADELLSNLDFIEFEPYVSEERENYGARIGKRMPEEFKRYKVYDIHDLRNGNFYVWIEGSSKLNRREEPSPYANVEGSIYTVLGFDETPDDSFPLPMPRQIKSMVEGYNYMLSFAVNHAQRGNRKYKMLEGNMAPLELDKWEKGADMTTVKVKSMEGGPLPIEDAPVPGDVYNVSGILKREITEATGVSAYARSGREPGVDTAFEANLIQGGSDIKIQEKREIVREFIIDNVRKLNQILRMYADTPIVLPITGLKGKKWIKWTAEDIKGEFLEDVDIYTSLPYTELEEKKQAMEMFSLAQNDPFFDALKLRQKVVQLMKWPEDVLKPLSQIQQEQQAAQQQAQEAQRQQSKTLRPSEGEVRRRPDMRAGIIGPARRVR